MLSIRDATEGDIPGIECMVSDFVRDHPAKDHPRSIVGMVQWYLIHDMFRGIFGVEAAWLYVKPQCRCKTARTHRGS